MASTFSETELEAASKWAAKVWLESQPDLVQSCLEQALRAPNSGLLLVYEDGCAITLRHASREVLDSSALLPLVAPQKSVYIPVAALPNLLGVDVPSFTYNKQTDVVVVVVLCGLDADSNRMYHATFVYS